MQLNIVSLVRLANCLFASPGCWLKRNHAFSNDMYALALVYNYCTTSNKKTESLLDGVSLLLISSSRLYHPLPIQIRASRCYFLLSSLSHYIDKTIIFSFIVIHQWISAETTNLAYNG